MELGLTLQFALIILVIIQFVVMIILFGKSR